VSDDRYTEDRVVDVLPYGMVHVSTCTECGCLVNADYRAAHDRSHTEALIPLPTISEVREMGRQAHEHPFRLRRDEGSELS